MATFPHEPPSVPVNPSADVDDVTDAHDSEIEEVSASDLPPAVDAMIGDLVRAGIISEKRAEELRAL